MRRFSYLATQVRYYGMPKRQALLQEFYMVHALISVREVSQYRDRYRQTQSADGCYLRIFRAAVSSVVLGSVPKRNNAAITDYRCSAYHRRCDVR